MDVPLADSQGSRCPFQRFRHWSYVLEWDLWDGKGLGLSGRAPGVRTAVEVVERDPAPSFVGLTNLPAELWPAGPSG